MHLLALKEMHRQTPHEFHQTGDYFWHQNTGTRLGKGAFGEVFLGYNEPDSYQVAVKVVKEDFYKKEKKVYINLKREIDIMQVWTRIIISLIRYIREYKYQSTTANSPSDWLNLECGKRSNHFCPLGADAV